MMTEKEKKEFEDLKTIVKAFEKMIIVGYDTDDPLYKDEDKPVMAFAVYTGGKVQIIGQSEDPKIIKAFKENFQRRGK